MVGSKDSGMLGKGEWNDLDVVRWVAGEERCRRRGACLQVNWVSTSNDAVREPKRCSVKYWLAA